MDTTLKYLFFDTETSGLPKDKNRKPFVHENTVDLWPHVVELAWIITDEEGHELFENEVIIMPDGWDIEDGAAEIHGITTDKAKEIGINKYDALIPFFTDVRRTEILVAHNIQFDANVMGAESYRLFKRNLLRDKIKMCTMLSSTKFCSIPFKNGKGTKWPKLQELHVKLFEKEFSGAHSALEDVRATVRCFFELKQRGII